VWPCRLNLMLTVFLFSLVKGLLRDLILSLALAQARLGRRRCSRRSAGKGQGWLPNWLPSAAGAQDSLRLSAEIGMQFWRGRSAPLAGRVGLPCTVLPSDRPSVRSACARAVAPRHRVRVAAPT
jgi:hypothetical protein